MTTSAAGFVNEYGLCIGTQPGTGPAWPQGSILSRLKVFQPATITPVATGATTAAEQTFTVTGLVVGDFIYGYSLTTPNVTNVVTITNMRVTAVNTLGITFANSTAGSLTFPAMTNPSLSIWVVNVDTF
jgi:hypothetical protein